MDYANRRKEVNMKIINRLVVVVCAVVMAAGSNLVAASCSQSDAKGTWRVNGLQWDKFRTDETESIACKLKVGSSGGISPSKSSCKVFGAGNIDVTGGKVVMAKNCAVSGNLQTNQGTVKFRSGQMDRSKDSMAILGVLDDFEFYLDAIKQ